MNMSMDQIIQKHEELSYKLRVALSTMERKSTIYEIRRELSEILSVDLIIFGICLFTFGIFEI